MKDNKLVSVIMSVYNDGDRVQKAIESILNQSYSNFELLITDDCSSDHTLRICNKYSELDNVKVYRNNENIGLTKSLNKLIELTKGDFIASQDSDDISHKMRIEKQIEYMETRDLLVSTTRATLLQNNYYKIRPRWSHLIPNKLVIKLKNPFIHGTLIIQKELLLEFGCYDESYYFAQDFKLFSDLINSGVKVTTLGENLYTLNTENNLSTKFKNQQQKFSNRILKENRKIISK
jgi:glycosyltransferase involved in cell wall biosynthesis